MSKYYIQDRMQYIGNSMYWWRNEHKGYTCDIREAYVFQSEEEVKEYIGDKSDCFKAWPKEYIDERVSYHIDTQSVDARQIKEQKQ